LQQLLRGYRPAQILQYLEDGGLLVSLVVHSLIMSEPG
jgi:hypothetical protein